ncbi:hypothetical protein [Oceanibacterium hippocampi]|uniref:Sarcosine oxidase, gamma subunit family n=1 Tax=Oceanibacterium hippocampi TaxID=745714 RepID=A0A1Y5T712_9PROT|nr:hypothetical protein [Oceanibacterium hippocampi]SLN57318.1 hypothetical protein OCH7691_02500 [Oceanibacterium hippocampi]
MIKLVPLPRRSPLHRRLDGLGAEWSFQGDAEVARHFGDPEGERTAAGRLALVDLSALPRGGYKGPAAIGWLAGLGALIGPEHNRAYPQADGSLIAKLAPTEAFILGPADGPADLLAAWEGAWNAEAADGAWPMPRRDSHCWFFLAGEAAPAMFAKLCAVDLRERAFPLHAVAQTSVARTNAILVSGEIGGHRGAHLLADSASADYLFGVFLDAMDEFDGRPAGLAAIGALG